MFLMVFSKHLAGPSLEEAGERLKAMGINAIDLTVRTNGHVDPERVEEELPKAQEALAKVGVSIGMITTGITEITSTSEKVLRTAAALGIRYYKLGYYFYREFGSLRKLRDEAKVRVHELAALNHEVGIHGGFHNHSSAFLGASLWDVDYILEGTNPKDIGCYLDPAHATIEGSSRGWEMGIDLILDRVTMLAVKDFRWESKEIGHAGARAFSLRVHPLENGNTEWPKILKILKSAGYNGPISLHSEYQGDASFADLTVDQVFKQTRKDAELFRKWWEQA